ncbi:MAG: NDP-sugar synthase [Planctomycetales bacterium]|nr:NDP-sugar synthase [bacterium]UNM07344.1 MAG: NDP-sugar synthase [Planctomycetales bacterium]
MKALLLIGGQATRLSPLNKHIAKSLMPLVDREVLNYQVGQLARAGVTQIILAAGHLVDQLAEYVDGYSGGLEFAISLEDEPLGTAGAIGNAAELVDNDRLVVLNADIISDVDITEVIAAHEAGGRPATLVGYSVKDPSRYGLLQVEGNAITGFTEKPEGQLDDEGKHFINAGIYVLEPSVVNSIPTDRKVSIERETFPQLIDLHGALTHFPHERMWEDIGTFESYFRANFALVAGRYTYGDNALWAGREDFALFKDMVYMHDSVELGKGVDLFHRVIAMARSRIGSESRLQNTILLPGAEVGERCQLTDCIIGPGVSVADGTRINKMVMVEGEQNTAFYPDAYDMGIS